MLVLLGIGCFSEMIMLWCVFLLSSNGNFLKLEFDFSMFLQKDLWVTSLLKFGKAKKIIITFIFNIYTLK